MASFVSTDNFQSQLWVQVSQQGFLSASRTSGEIMGKHFSHAFQLFFKCLSHGKFCIHEEFSGFENGVDGKHLRTWKYTSSLLLNPCSSIQLLFQFWFLLFIMNGWPLSVCFFFLCTVNVLFPIKGLDFLLLLSNDKFISRMIITIIIIYLLWYFSWLLSLFPEWCWINNFIYLLFTEYLGHSNITLATFEKMSDGSYIIKPIKQKQMVWELLSWTNLRLQALYKPCSRTLWISFFNLHCILKWLKNS